MIKLRIENIDKICQWYAENVCSWIRYNKNHNPYIQYVIDNLDSLVHCDAITLEAEIQRFNNTFPNYATSVDDDKINFEKYMVGQYNRMLDNIGKELHKRLDVKVCPYCNRQYTLTVSGNNKSIHPEFDHFYPKSIYPYLALSFYNLIPSCHTCNTAKKTERIEINPYIEDFGDHAKFRIDRMDLCLFNNPGWKVELSSDNRCKTNIDAFCLNELYAMHGDHAQEIAFKKMAYNKQCLDEITKFLRMRNIDDVDASRIIFGNYIKKEDLGKRPLAKLTHDIIEQVSEIED